MPGLIVLIDLKIASDTISFNFIEQVIKHFNFGPMFQRWITLFLHDTNIFIRINGVLSNYFTTGRGCIQGDPISSYLVILCADFLAAKLKQCKQIQGIHIVGEDYKMSQFTDDTLLFLDGSEQSINRAIHLLHEFKKTSGL